MAKLNWDKVRQDNLMKKHGFETIPMTYPKINGKVTYGEREKVTHARAIYNKVTFKSGQNKKTKRQTATTINDLIQYPRCNAKVRRDNKRKHINKVHRGINSSKRPGTVSVKPNSDHKKNISIAMLAKELQPTIHQFIINCAHKAGIKITSPEQSIPERIANRIRFYFSSSWK